MKVHVHSIESKEQATWQAYAQKRAIFTFTRLSPRIVRIEIDLADTNGPRGGVDQRCKVQVHLLGNHVTVAEDTSSDMFVAIDHALSKAGRAVARQVKRELEIPRLRVREYLAVG